MTQIDVAPMSPVQCGCGMGGVRQAEQHPAMVSPWASIAGASAAHVMTERTRTMTVTGIQETEFRVGIEGVRIAVRYPRYPVVPGVSTVARFDRIPASPPRRYL